MVNTNNLSQIVAECNPCELPFVSFWGKEFVTTSSGIYFVLWDSTVMYIGKSRCIRARWASHGQLDGLQAVGSELTIAWLEYSLETVVDKIALGLIEKALIDKFKPYLNTQLFKGASERDLDKLLAEQKKLLEATRLRMEKEEALLEPKEEETDEELPYFPRKDGGSTAASIDRLSIKQVLQQYDIKKTALYERLNALNIRPEKTLKGSYLNAEQLELFDELDKFIKNGGRIAEFIDLNHRKNAGKPPDATESYSTMTSSVTPAHIDNPSQMVEIIATQRSPIQFQLVDAPDLLENLRSLSEAVRRNWHLPTSILLRLLGLKSVPRVKSGVFRRYGFEFRRMERTGRESEWSVKKGHNDDYKY